MKQVEQHTLLVLSSGKESCIFSSQEEGYSKLRAFSSPATGESVCLNGSKLKEFNYMGLSSDCSLVDSLVPLPSFSDESKSNLNLKATELRLGLPGSQSPERDSDLCLRSSAQFDEKPLFPLHPLTDDHHSSSAKPAVLGSKRGFSDAMNGFSEPFSNRETSTRSKMAYQNHNMHPHKWHCHMDEYEVTIQEPAYPKHHHQKERVAFRTSYETPRRTEHGAVRHGTRFGYKNADENVDEEAENFIQHEHKRMELARLMSSVNYD